MIAQLCLADTSTWHWARAPTARAALQAELDAGRVATCAIIDAELMVSARGSADADELMQQRRALRWLSIRTTSGTSRWRPNARSSTPPDIAW